LSKRPSSRGRPSKFSDPMIGIAQRLAEDGKTDEQIAHILGISRSTLNEWKAQHPALSGHLKKGKRSADKQVERALFERATGYSHPDVHVSNYQGEVTITPITKHYPPDTGAMVFWLKNRKPKRWADKVQHEPAPPVGPGLTIVLQQSSGVLIQKPLVGDRVPVSLPGPQALQISKVDGDTGP
jgi:hypothetical protein